MNRKFCKIISLLSILFIFTTFFFGCGAIGHPTDSEAIKTIKQLYIEANLDQYYVIENITIRVWKKYKNNYIADVEIISRGAQDNYVAGSSVVFPTGNIEKDKLYKKTGPIVFAKVGDNWVIVNS